MLALLALVLAVGRLVGPSGADNASWTGFMGIASEVGTPAVHRADVLWDLYDVLQDILDALQQRKQERSSEGGDPQGSNPDPEDDVTEEERESVNDGADQLEEDSIYVEGDRVDHDTTLDEALEFVELLVVLIEAYDGGGEN